MTDTDDGIGILSETVDPKADIGCRKDGYCSDMTRTFFCGEPAPVHAAIHDLVREANEKAEAMIRPGVRFCDIDRAAREYIEAGGYGQFFTHRLGHSIGLEDHEFGVRVEDLVTEDGCEILNRVEKRWKTV